MMYDQIMQRPMFQTPQQRQGMGIMAGVAPVRGYAEGDFVSDDFFSTEQTEAGSGINLRDLTDLLIVDPEDPIDLAMTTAAAGLIAFPPAAALAAMARMGYKGTKLVDKMRKLSEVQKSLRSADKLNPIMNPSSQGIVGLKEASKAIGKVEGARIAALPAQEVRDSDGNQSPMIEAVAMAQQMPSESSSVSVEDVINMPSVYEMTQGYASGGIAHFAPGGKVGLALGAFSKVVDFVSTNGSRGLEALGEGVKRQLSKGQADQLVDQAKKADKVLGEAGAETVEQGQRLVLKKPDGELIETPIGKVPKPPEPPVTPKVADDATKAAKGAAEEAGETATKRRPIRRIGQAGAVGAAGVGATDLALGTNFLSTGLEKIGDAYGAARDDVAATLEMPEIVALRERVNPDTGERVELTESVMEQVDLNKDGKISDEERKAIKEKADQAVAAQQKPEAETGTPVPEATGIMKFLFGKDGIGGDPGAVGKTMDYLADPKTRYALARAAESRPGVVDRNFFTDFTLGQAEYDQLQGKDETALMQNYEFLKQAGKSDDEIFDLLLSKDTASDQAERYQDQVLSLFNAARKDPNNTGRSTAELLEEARSTAAAIILNQSVATPKDSEVVETVDLE